SPPEDDPSSAFPRPTHTATMTATVPHRCPKHRRVDMTYTPPAQIVAPIPGRLSYSVRCGDATEARGIAIGDGIDRDCIDLHRERRLIIRRAVQLFGPRKGADLMIQTVAESLLLTLEIVASLEVHPETLGGAEVPR